MTKKITLSIETAVGGGSLSLFENEKLLDEWSGESKISRSERFLPILDEFLSRNNIRKNDLDLIAVSRGPGSFTGARIGLATAVALKNGLGVECVGISVLRAIAISSMETLDTMKSDLITAILNNKTQVIREKFSSRAESSCETSNYSGVSRKLTSDGAKLSFIEDFVSEIKSNATQTVVMMEKRLFDQIVEKIEINNTNLFSEMVDIRYIGDNLSIYVGKAAIKKYASDNLRLFYLDTDVNCR